MKWIGFLLVLIPLIVLVLFAWGPSGNKGDIARAQSVLASARAAQESAVAAQIAAQGMSDVGRGLTLILILLIVILVLLAALVVYIVLFRFPILKYTQASRTSRRWVSGPNAQWQRLQEPDINHQVLLQQEWLMAQFLQGQANSEEVDAPQLPANWWS